ncbi:TIR domain-containing protein [Arachnia propionica]|uniref:CD-NTase-associated protein 12/Pycsar effector protein TIR domain-containing protein n=1 Tax=Arachnia propionica TaxID=1750 RepID=A0A3P1WQB1_9ACTN|nr:TIR domain-containing protein [Arachnia propionica]RRD48774.1 hypothetical protein EII35_11240 [Arachnia propionica]
MAKDVLERVFIAWGGTQRLATLVGQRISELGFDPVVGGGSPTELFIGTQVFSQIRGCTRAIILVNGEGIEANPGIGLNDNLMFEWGYITGTYSPNKLHVFLIDISVKDLPSDLGGSWATEVTTQERDVEEIADAIVEAFQKDARRHVELDKLKIMHMWEDVKRFLDMHDTSPQCSDLELAQYLLHTAEVCDYYMEEEYTESLLNKVQPSSSILSFVILLLKNNIRLGLETGGLAEPLPFDSFTEMRAVFESKFDFSYQDEEIDLWLRYFTARRLSLLYRLVSLNEDFSDEERLGLLQSTVSFLERAGEILEEISKRFPLDASYVNLYRGYVERDKYRVYDSLGQKEEAEVSNAAALVAKESFYLTYKEKYPHDTFMIRQLAQEYYRSQAERMDFITDVTEKVVIKKTLRSFLSKLDKDNGRQHVVLQELRRKLG